jgi:hypothetical protein
MSEYFVNLHLVIGRITSISLLGIFKTCSENVVFHVQTAYKFYE